MMKYFFAIICVISVFTGYALGGECLKDSNYGHPASAYNTRLWSYNPKSATQVSTSSQLHFMSYNLQSSISNACVSNAPAQASLMTTSDYVGNQEVAQGIDTRCNCNMPQIIADTTGMKTRFCMTEPFRTGQYGIGLGTSQVILDTKYALLSYSGAEQRALVAVRTQPAALKGKNLWFIATHVEYYIWAARQAQIAQLVQWVESNIFGPDPQATVVIVGDFNSGPGDQAYTTMSGVFKNAWAVYSGSTGGGFTYPAQAPANRFDHLWYKGPSSVTITIKSFEIVNTQDSDHRPIRAVLDFAVSGSSSSGSATASPTTAPNKGTSAPTTKPTSAPANPTSAPSSGGSCSATASFNKDNNQITVTNTGSKAIKNIVLTFSPSLPSNHWNLDSKGGNQYTLPSFAYQSLATNGGKYTSSGFYPSGTAPTITVSTVTC